MENCYLIDSDVIDSDDSFSPDSDFVSGDDFSPVENPDEELRRYVKIYRDAVSKGAMFDA